MAEPKVYLSHGGGQNSWALYLWLIEQGEVPGQDFEAVFVDHATDWPETYEYMQMMIDRGYPVTVLKPEYEGFHSIYERCLKYASIPSRLSGMRWCTMHFKVRPLEVYYQRPAVEIIGFDASEDKRRARLQEKDDVTKDFPLYEAGIDRQGCADLMKRHGLPVPHRSSCFICPFQTRHEWIELQDKHPDLFCKAVSLEQLTNERRLAAGKEPVYFRDIPLDILVRPKDSKGRRAIKGQLAFPGLERPCSCGL